jgi:hypothetical protein
VNYLEHQQRQRALCSEIALNLTEYSNNFIDGLNERNLIISLADVFHQLANTHSKQINHYLNGLKGGSNVWCIDHRIGTLGG